jgi:sRNA-binding regulator protein Hfq
MKSKLSIIFITAYLLTGCAVAISERHNKESGNLLYYSDNRDKLIKMAEKRFGKLTEADKILFAAVANGNWANYSEGEDKDKPEDANSWPERRTINANRIEWLCSDRQAKELVTDKGISVIGARIVGAVDLSFREIPFPLFFYRCVFNENIYLMDSKMTFLFLNGSHTSSIQADGVRIEGSVVLGDGFKAEGTVSFQGAAIGGNFYCKNGEFINKGGFAIIADGMDVKGYVVLRDGFKANGEVRFSGATIGRNFDCNNGKFSNEGGNAIFAGGIDVKGTVFLKNGFKANGEVCFQGAVIDGSLDCEKGEFINEKGYAIEADGINVKGSVFLTDGFKSNGEVCFQGVVIDGSLDCDKGEFINEKGYAIEADGINVKGSVFLTDGFKANGEVRFPGAAIGRDFDCNNGEFINKGGRAISANRMDVKGSVFLIDGFKANGEVRFPGATIGGNFECENGEFINEGGVAIYADGIDVKGCVFLTDGFKANGEVCFRGAAIGGNFGCNGGNFINEKRYAIFADEMNVKGSVFLRDGFKSNGEVRFPLAAIGGDFDCNNGGFINEDGKAIFAERMDVKGNVFLRNGFKTNGEVSFQGAAIGRNFDCENGAFINKGGTAISVKGMDVKGNVYLRNGFKAEGLVSLMGATIGGYFVWSNVNLTEKTILDLRNAKTGVLWDDSNSWPKKNNLFLDGFVYENIGDESPKDARSRIEWLNRQGEKRFRPGPYEQLAKVLEKSGHNKDAIMVRIEKEEKITKLGGFGLWGRFWGDVLWVTIGYGYRPWRALYSIGLFILIGFIVFRSGHKAGVIVQADKEAYKFNALIYSIDMFVPVLDLCMKKYWMPDANRSGTLKLNKRSFTIRGSFIRGYMWFHIGAGWILTTLLIVGLTGLVKK